FPSTTWERGNVAELVLRLLLYDHADFDAAILRESLLGIAVNGGPIRAVAVCVERGGGQAETDEIFAHGQRAPFAERAIIFRRAALVSVAREEKGMAGVRLEPLADRLQFALFRGGNGRLVEIEIDRVRGERLVI